MFRKIGDGLRRFMAGRYGSDRLNQCLLGAAYVLLYALFYFWTDALRIPWLSQCFDWPGNLCLPAGLVLAGLRPRAKERA